MCQFLGHPVHKHQSLSLYSHLPVSISTLRIKKTISQASISRPAKCTRYRKHLASFIYNQMLSCNACSFRRFDSFRHYFSSDKNSHCCSIFCRVPNLFPISSLPHAFQHVPKIAYLQLYVSFWLGFCGQMTVHKCWLGPGGESVRKGGNGNKLGSV